MQLGDCGQEMALISRLTEGTKAFLSREESQHFLKESVSVIVHNKTVLAEIYASYITLTLSGARFSTVRLCSNCSQASFKIPLTL